MLLKTSQIIALGALCTIANLAYADVKTNKDEAQKTLKDKYDKVIFGKELDHVEYAEMLLALSTGPSGVGVYLTDLVKDIATETGGQIAADTAYDLLSGHTESTIVSGKTVYVDLQTYNWWDETSIPCVHLKVLHPAGHEIDVPCTHIGPKHDKHKVLGKNIRCWHLGKLHGHHHETIPCVHTGPAHRSHKIKTPLPNTHQIVIGIGKK